MQDHTTDQLHVEGTVAERETAFGIERADLVIQGREKQQIGMRRSVGEALAGLFDGGARCGGQGREVESEVGIQNVEHAQTAVRRFAADGEGFRQKVIQGFAGGEPRPKLGGFGDQFCIIQGFDPRGERVDRVHQGKQALDLTLVRGAENFGEQCVQNHETVASKKTEIAAPKTGANRNRAKMEAQGPVKY